MDMHDVYENGESWKTGSAAKRRRMESYLEWLLTPKDVRDPKTKTEFAAMLDVTIQTLTNYERDAWFKRELWNRARRSLKVTKWAEVVEAMFGIATDPGNRNAVSAARLLKEIIVMDIGESDNVDFDAKSIEELERLLELE